MFRGFLEQAAARLALSIIDNDPLAQVILFHDSRQGAERIAAHAGRPGPVAPYRAGYLHEARRDIEDRPRSNTVRALIATSALEVGIDMPYLNYAINLGLPPTRKQLDQRLGRCAPAPSHPTGRTAFRTKERPSRSACGPTKYAPS